MKDTQADLDQMTPGENAMAKHRSALMQLRTIGKVYAGWIARESLHHSAATIARRDGLAGRVAKGRAGYCRQLATLRSLTFDVERLGRRNLAEGYLHILLGKMQRGQVRGLSHAMRHARPGG